MVRGARVLRDARPVRGGRLARGALALGRRGRGEPLWIILRCRRGSEQLWRALPRVCRRRDRRVREVLEVHGMLCSDARQVRARSRVEPGLLLTMLTGQSEIKNIISFGHTNSMSLLALVISVEFFLSRAK